MSHLIPIDQLSKEFDSSEFVLKTQHQIAKDFDRVGVQFPETFYTIPQSIEVISTLIQPHLETLEKTNQLLQLAYLIDLPETHFHQNDFEALSFLIIRREAYKVFLRSALS